MDAGTDNGFTFTSPNWPTSPQGSIFRITNVYPDHPAGSFNYPEKPSLPTIAKFTFIKVCLPKILRIILFLIHFDVYIIQSINSYYLLLRKKNLN